MSDEGMFLSKESVDVLPSFIVHNLNPFPKQSTFPALNTASHENFGGLFRSVQMRYLTYFSWSFKK